MNAFFEPTYVHCLSTRKIVCTPINLINFTLSFLQLYFAEYSFLSRSENEVSLFEGQVVTVLSKEDLEGNPEWWLVDADGHQGYTPAIYLKKMVPHDDNTW